MELHNTSNVSTLLFDLGGVLFQLSGASIVCQWSQDKLTPPELMRKWLISPAVRAFESGRIDFLEFRRQLKMELKLLVADDEFAAVFNSWITGVYPGTEALLERLSSRYDLACFSNTNPVHWEILTGDYNVLDYFDQTFASFQMGLVKPDTEAFLHVIDRLAVPAEAIVFFDDSQPNVDAALACGMRAFRVSGIDGVSEAIQRSGLL
jgi:putative hydrolase of the HAD superfamily